MSEGEIHQWDVGTVLHVTVVDHDEPVDCSQATVKEIIARRPDGSIVVWPATFSSTGVDGGLSYTTVEGDLSQTGVWDLEAYVEIPNWQGYSDWQQIAVFPIVKKHTA